jgi:hypothetical protein
VPSSSQRIAPWRPESWMRSALGATADQVGSVQRGGASHGTLTLEAKRATENGGPALAREYDEADFARSFRIPAGIDAVNIKAEAKNGTVLVRLPKIAAVKARKIAVQST